MPSLSFDDSRERIDYIKNYYKAKGFKTGAAFLRKVVDQYIRSHALKAQDCTNQGITETGREYLKSLIREVLQELKNERNKI